MTTLETKNHTAKVREQIAHIQERVKERTEAVGKLKATVERGVDAKGYALSGHQIGLIERTITAYVADIAKANRLIGEKRGWINMLESRYL